MAGLSITMSTFPPAKLADLIVVGSKLTVRGAVSSETVGSLNTASPEANGALMTFTPLRTCHSPFLPRRPFELSASIPEGS